VSRCRRCPELEWGPRVVNMNAILYENRSHYYYGIGLLHRKSKQCSVPAILRPLMLRGIENAYAFRKIIAGDLPLLWSTVTAGSIAFLTSDQRRRCIYSCPEQAIPTATTCRRGCLVDWSYVHRGARSRARPSTPESGIADHQLQWRMAARRSTTCTCICSRAAARALGLARTITQ